MWSDNVAELILWMRKANVIWESQVIEALSVQRPFQQTVPQGQKHVLPQFVIDGLNFHSLLIRLLRTPPKNVSIVPMKLLVQLFYFLQLIHWRRVLINLVIARLFDWLLHLWLGSPCPLILLVLLLCADFFECGLFLIFLLFFVYWFLFCVYFLCLVEKWCLIKLRFRLFQFRNCLCLSYLFWELLFLDFRLLI